MPIYEFHCVSCEKDSEILVRSSAGTDVKCPHCGATRLAKKFSTFAAAGAGGKAAAPAAKPRGGGGGCCGGGPHRH